MDTNLLIKAVIAPKDIVQLSFDISGRVQSVAGEIGDEVRAGDALVQLDTTILEVDVARAEAVLQAAQAQFEYDKLQRNAKALQAITAAQISAAEADLAKARAILAQATLVSPLNGTIIGLQAAPGETVSPGKVIVTLADLQNLQVETLDLAEQDIPRVFVGQPAEIYIEALDLKTEGNVVAIAPRSTTLGEKSVYTVTIGLKSRPNDLRWGMSAEVSFILDE
jgi:RND family efflux transporter MFP subunit